MSSPSSSDCSVVLYRPKSLSLTTQPHHHLPTSCSTSTKQVFDIPQTSQNSEVFQIPTPEFRTPLLSFFCHFLSASRFVYSIPLSSSLPYFISTSHYPFRGKPSLRVPKTSVATCSLPRSFFAFRFFFFDHLSVSIILPVLGFDLGFRSALLTYPSNHSST